MARGVYLLGAMLFACAAMAEPATLNVPADYKTIQAAVDAAKDGDIVLIAPGTYPGGIMLKDKSVTLASRFLTSHDPKDIENTILQLEGKSGAVIHVDKTAGPGTRIVGLSIRDGADGIACRAQITIEHNHITGSVDGVDYESGGGVCRNNTFEKCRDDGVDLDWSCDVTIEDNVFRDNHDDGIEARMYPYEGKEPLRITIRNNLIAGSGEDGIQLIDHEGPSNRIIRIEHNVIRDTAKAAIGCMDKAKTREDYRGADIPDPIFVIGNTLMDNHYGLTGGGKLVALNNVFLRTKQVAAKRVAGIMAYNLFWANGKDIDACNVDEKTTVRKDPLLDAAAKPATDSPCIDAGTAAYVWEGKAVLDLPTSAYSGRAPDLGAFEGAARE